MCGISGFIRTRGSDQSDLRILRSMLESIKHRGPDNTGIWQDSHICIGHTRLSIIDLSKNGNQPMISLSQRYICSFNGEIYNFKDLKKQLEGKGYVFRSTSDTEVLLCLIEEHGIKTAIQKCVGMFAISIWDKKKKELSLVRDRFGEKPLYYGWQGKNFIFASELKAFKLHPSFRAEINLFSLAEFLKFGFIYSTERIFRNIFKLEPGNIFTLKLNKNGGSKGETSEYWSLKETIFESQLKVYSSSYNEAGIQLEKLLGNSVEQQMQSDVPIGCMLSGGVDSSLIAALMQERSDSPIKTFSIGFDNETLNEAHHAEKVAKYLGTDHHSLYAGKKEFIEAVTELPEVYDEPFADPSQLPTFLVNKLASQYVTVVLTGDGADEIFFGYKKYRTGNIISKLPHRRALGKIFDTIPRSLIIPFINIIGRRDLSTQSLEFFSMLLNSKSNLELADILSFDRGIKDVVNFNEFYRHNNSDSFKNVPISSYHNSARYLDIKRYLSNDILTKVDRASMAVSLESRAPFLDHRVLELVNRFPSNFSSKYFVQKRILKDVVFRHIPKKLIDRPKMGFTPPISDILKTDISDWASDVINMKTNLDDLLSKKDLKKILGDHICGKSDNSSVLWRILMLKSWSKSWL